MTGRFSWGAWKKRVAQLKLEMYALYLAYRDPRTPWHAKLLLMLLLGYAFSPIDLIPDFIPILGYLDDLILLPLGIALALRMVPRDVMAECRERAQQAASAGRPTSRIAAAIIIAIWVVLAAASAVIVWRVTR